MSKQQIFPRIWTIIKNAWKIYRNAAKYFPVDTGITILCIVAVIYWLFNPDVWLEGAVAILFGYSIYTTIRLNWNRVDIKELKRKLDDCITIGD